MMAKFEFRMCVGMVSQVINSSKFWQGYFMSMITWIFSEISFVCISGINNDRNYR